MLVSVLVERESSCIVTGSDQAKEEEEEGRVQYVNLGFCSCVPHAT